MFNRVLSLFLLGVIFTGLVSCNDDEGPAGMVVPDTYTFTRNGQSTVSFQGQTDRLDMLSEIKTYVKSGDAGEALDATVFMNMYANENSPFSDPALNNSTKQLKDKTFLSDVTFYEDLFQEAETISVDVANKNTAAADGIGGLIERSNGNTILVNEKGWEFTQFIEKGLMGAVFYNQIFNVYLTDDRIGNDVENDVLAEGQNYTPMEHHWDEAFGYWGVPVDFPQGDPVLETSEDRFWAAYTHDRNALINVSEPLMNAYLQGRTAIVNKDYATKDAQREVIYDLHELITAATAVHYINSALGDLNAGEQGDFLHHISEAWTFVNAIKYSPRARLTSTQIDDILNSDFGTEADFWTATEAGLQNAKATLVAAYPLLSSVQNQL